MIAPFLQVAAWEAESNKDTASVSETHGNGSATKPQLTADLSKTSSGFLRPVIAQAVSLFHATGRIAEARMRQPGAARYSRTSSCDTMATDGDLWRQPEVA